jgi:hypothetical protein
MDRERDGTRCECEGGEGYHIKLSHMEYDSR